MMKGALCDLQARSREAGHDSPPAIRTRSLDSWRGKTDLDTGRQNRYRCTTYLLRNPYFFQCVSATIHTYPTSWYYHSQWQRQTGDMEVMHGGQGLQCSIDQSTIRNPIPICKSLRPHGRALLEGHRRSVSLHRAVVIPYWI